MKKTILVISLVIMSFLTYSQTYFQSFKTEIGTFNERTRDWEFEKGSVSTMLITVEKSYIQVDDDAHSLYRIQRRLEDVRERDYTSWAWETLDEKNRTCIVQFTNYFNRNVGTMMVIYNNACIVYNLKRNK